jgi:trk system potassium uptake protein TrkH
MDYRQLSRSLGMLLLLVAASMVACLAYAVYDNEANYAADRALGLSALITLAAGGLLVLLGRRGGREIFRREAIAIVGLGWILSTLFGALPYVFAEPALSPAAAVFESASGFTTTGASAIKDVEIMPRGILLWRATTQWLGGMGILVLFVAVLSMAGGGSKSLFRRESSAKFSEGFSSSMKETAIRLWQIYVGLSAVCALGLIVLGMPVFDSVCHTFATLSTGGFSTKNLSIAYYKSPAIEWWIILFMLIGAISFMLYAWLLARRWSKWKQDEETRFYLGFLAVVSIAVTASLLHHANAPDFATALRNAVFQVVSISSTTGFVTDDYDKWSDFARILIVAVMFVGGCAGSTAGGIKVGRLMVFFKNFRRQLIHTFRPGQIVPVRINGVPLSDSYLAEVGLFLALVGFIVALGSLAMAALEPSFDLVSSFGAVIATLFNTGPGLGAVGPTLTYADLGAPAHLLLSLLMIMGRLEILAMLALFVPQLWRRY